MRKILIGLLIALPVIGLSQKSSKTKKNKADIDHAFVDYRAIGAPLPELRGLTQDGKWITNESVKNDANLLVMLFNPTCEHCEEMTVLIKKNIFLFKKSKIVLVAAPGMMEYIDYFRNNTQITQFPSIQVGVDSTKLVEKLYNYVALPQISFYDHDRKLLKTFNGDTPIDSLKLYIE